MEIRRRASLITGASRGLGRALALRLAAAGSRVVLVARRADPLEAVVAELQQAGLEAYGVPGDIGELDDAHRIAGQAAALVGPVDILVHNASTLGPTPLRLLLDTDCEDLTRVLETNLVGPFRLTKIVAGSMALRGTGVILHVSSDAAVSAYPNWGAYGISKAAQDQLSRILAAELAGTQVRVLAVDPGEMDTEMHRDALPDADRASLARAEDVAARLVAMIRDERDAPNGARLEVAAWGSGFASGCPTATARVGEVTS